MKALLTTALALTVLVGTAGAQDLLALNDGPAPRVVAADPPLVPARLVRALQSASSDTRAEALNRMLTLAYGSPDGVDLSPAIPDLLTIASEDLDVRLRISALRAIEASGDEGAMAALRSSVEREVDPMARRVRFWILHNHYGADVLRDDARFTRFAQSVLGSWRG